MSMTTKQMAKVLRGVDDDAMMALLQKIISATTIDEAGSLLEDIQAGERANTVEDVCIDLADFGQAEAVEIIKANY
jgi:hypothetical protein